MILQGINEIIGGSKMKREGKREFAELQKERDDAKLRMSTTAQELKNNAYDRSMVDRMNENALIRSTNLMNTAGRNPLAAAKLSSTILDEGRKADQELRSFIDSKNTRAEDIFRSEELRVQDANWADFQGREKRSLDKIQMGQERVSGGLGSLDSAITSAVTMGMTPAPAAPPGPGSVTSPQYG